MPYNLNNFRKTWHMHVIYALTYFNDDFQVIKRHANLLVDKKLWCVQQIAALKIFQLVTVFQFVTTIPRSRCHINTLLSVCAYAYMNMHVSEFILYYVHCFICILSCLSMLHNYQYNKCFSLYSFLWRAAG
jgi:hypothetical protein